MHHPPVISAAPPPRSALPAWHDRLLVAVFAASLAAPHAAALLGWCRPFDPQVEKRMPARFPEVAWSETGWLRRPKTKDLMLLPAGLEDWLIDRTGLRQESIAAVGRARMAGWLPGETLAFGPPAMLRSNPVEHLAVRGLDGWCFYVSGNQVAELAGRGTLPESRLAATWRRFEERRAWLAAQGIAYVVVVAPNKETIYPEYLPAWAGAATGRTPLDQFVELAARRGGPPVVDLRPELRAAKAAGRTYFVTDTHWSSFGALVGCRAVLRECALLCPGLEPPPLEHFAKRTEVMADGDLVRMLGVQGIEERIDVFERTGSPAEPPSGSPRVYLIGDSFSSGLRRHLRGCCVLAGSAPHDEFPVEAILEARPQVVIHEFVERHLAGMDRENPPVVARAAGMTVAGADDAPPR